MNRLSDWARGVAWLNVVAALFFVLALVAGVAAITFVQLAALAVVLGLVGIGFSILGLRS